MVPEVERHVNEALPLLHKRRAGLGKLLAATRAHGEHQDSEQAGDDPDQHQQGQGQHAPSPIDVQSLLRDGVEQRRAFPDGAAEQVPPDPEQEQGGPEPVEGP